VRMCPSTFTGTAHRDPERSFQSKKHILQFINFLKLIAGIGVQLQHGRAHDLRQVRLVRRGRHPGTLQRKPR